MLRFSPLSRCGTSSVVRMVGISFKRYGIQYSTTDHVANFIQAWEKSAAGEWNLSGPVVTSKKAKRALRIYMQENPDFLKEIEDKIGEINLDAIAPEPLPEKACEFSINEDYDDSDVPLRAVAQQALGVTLSHTEPEESGSFCVLPTSVVEERAGGFLRGDGDEEDIWAYREDGSRWIDVLDDSAQDETEN